MDEDEQAIEELKADYAQSYRDFKAGKHEKPDALEFPELTSIELEELQAQVDENG